MKNNYKVKNQGSQMVKAPKGPVTNKAKTVRKEGNDLRTGKGK